MNKTLVNKAIKIFKQTAKEFGIEDIMINANDSPLRKNDQAVYIDGDVYDAYWGYDFWGWDFQNKVTESLEKAGLWVEAYSNSILDVYSLEKR